MWRQKTHSIGSAAGVLVTCSVTAETNPGEPPVADLTSPVNDRHREDSHSVVVAGRPHGELSCLC